MRCRLHQEGLCEGSDLLIDLLALVRHYHSIIDLAQDREHYVKEGFVGTLFHGRYIPRVHKIQQNENGRLGGALLRRASSSPGVSKALTALFPYAHGKPFGLFERQGRVQRGGVAYRKAQLPR